MRRPLTPVIALTAALALLTAVGCQTTPDPEAAATQPTTQPDEKTGWTPPLRPEPRKTILERQRDNISRSVRRASRY